MHRHPSFTLFAVSPCGFLTGHSTKRRLHTGLGRSSDRSASASEPGHRTGAKQHVGGCVDQANNGPGNALLHNGRSAVEPELLYPAFELSGVLQLLDIRSRLIRRLFFLGHVQGTACDVTQLAPGVGNTGKRLCDVIVGKRSDTGIQVRYASSHVLRNLLDCVIPRLLLFSNVADVVRRVSFGDVVVEVVRLSGRRLDSVGHFILLQ